MEFIPLLIIMLYGLLGIITIVLLIYVIIDRINTKEDFEKRDN